MRRFGLFIVAALLAGCSLGADVPLAQTAVDGFHRQLDAGKFAELYAGAAPELRAAATEKQWIELLDAVHRKLGKFKSAAQTGWNDQMTTSGHLIGLTYQSTYERGAATEQLSYKIVSGKALLLGYHVNSNALIVN